MYLTEIQTRLNALSDLMLKKGLRSPSAQLDIESHKGQRLFVRYNPDVSLSEKGSELSDRKYEWFNAPTLEEAFEKAKSWVAVQPDFETRRREEFQSALGRLIDLGRDNGIEVDYLNPLMETAKRLSENALTHQPHKEEE